MNAGARVAAFVAVFGVVFGVAALAGGAVGPTPHKPAQQHKPSNDEMAMTAGQRGGHDVTSMGPAGLSISQDGYRLTVADTSFSADRTERLRFRVLDAHGQPAHDFEEEHGAKLHLIIVRRDLRGYQHLHPSLAVDGTWSTALTFAEPGAYRMFADFRAGGKALTLGADLFVPGDFQPRSLPAPAGSVSVDGYEVALTEASPGALHFAVRRGGREVADLQPYLGARGHLVALRQGDLAYLHVHPEEGPMPGTGISFHAEYPSTGRYRLFLQFKHHGRVHTAELTREVTR